ncbi:MAG TPA: OmpA family protein [Flavobacteriales bacterium]|nr:OmpA family protein [Flavobacteriales bacterium]
MEQVKIHIPEPCHENWDTMTHAEQGRHCKKCDKVVMDFAGYSDQKLRQVISNMAIEGKKACGRFRNDQLVEKPEAYVEIEHYSLSPRQIFILTILVVFFLGGLASCKIERYTLGIMDMETKQNVSVKQHLRNFDNHCATTGRTLGPFIHPKVDTVKRDTVIIVRPEKAVKAFFDSNSFILNERSKEALDQFVSKLKGKKYSLEITGHTDDRGSEIFNEALSYKRAISVKNYLVSKGVTVDVCRGVGYQHPVSSNASIAGRADNRRVEILILWK